MVDPASSHPPFCLCSSAALMTANQRYVINGDWIIDWPGVYEVAGTQVRYARTADVHESFEAAGPTHEDLSVMVRGGSGRGDHGILSCLSQRTRGEQHLTTTSL